MPTRVAVDDDEQQIQDLIKEMRRLRSRLATTAVKGTHDEFTAAATPATTYTLTYIPLSGTCLMALNGHVQREGVDYSVAYDTGVVTVSATQASGDKITFRYLVTDWLIARSLPAETDPNGKAIIYNTTTSVTSATWTLDAPTKAGAIAVLVLEVGSSSVSSVSGLGATWTHLDSEAVLRNYEIWIGTGCTVNQSTVTATAAASVKINGMVVTLPSLATVVSWSTAFTSGFTSPYVLPSATATGAGQTVMTIGMADSGSDTGITWTDSPSAWTEDFTATETFVGSNNGILYARHIAAASGTTYQTKLNHNNNDGGAVWTLLLGP